jgi:hypothetical protein
VLFELKKPNRGFQANAQPPANLNMWYVQPQELDPPIYINPLLGGSTFFSKCDRSIDGVPIQDSNFDGGQEMLYHVANRIFTTDAVRREKYGDALTWISNRAERDYTPAVAEVQGQPRIPGIPPGPQNNPPGVAAQQQVNWVVGQPIKRHPSLVRAMDPITFDAVGESEPGMLSFGFDGCFPFSCQNNTLRMLTGQKIENGFLHPGAEFTFSLHKREPILAAVERANITDAQYFGDEAIPDASVAAPAMINGCQLIIKAIFLNYESVELKSSEQIDRFRKSTSRYCSDIVLYRQNNLGDGVMHDTKHVSLPGGTKLVYLMWIYESQITYGARANSYLSARLRFPPLLKHLQLSISGGAEGLVVKTGLDDLGRKEGRGSPSLKIYHEELMRKNIYTKSFDSFFPPWRADAARGNNLGYDQVLVLDLTPYTIPEGAELTVEMTYDGLAAARWYLRSYHVKQRLFEYNERSKWTFKDVA